jgi:hypothetical protein
MQALLRKHPPIRPNGLNSDQKSSIFNRHEQYLSPNHPRYHHFLSTQNFQSCYLQALLQHSTFTILLQMLILLLILYSHLYMCAIHRSIRPLSYTLKATTSSSLGGEDTSIRGIYRLAQSKKLHECMASKRSKGAWRDLS